MNCDQVFDVLTRGPFPTGCQSDVTVERHLAACHECRELAEALQPAVNLFHEVLIGETPDTLPRYKGLYSDSSVACLPLALRAALADDARPQAYKPLVSRPASAAWLGGLQLSSTLALGPALAVLVVCALWLAPRVWPVAPLAASQGTEARTAQFQPDVLGQEWLVSLAKGRHCFPTATSLALGTAPELSTGFACCLKCHEALTSARPSLDATASLDRSCRACHNY